MWGKEMARQSNPGTGLNVDYGSHLLEVLKVELMVKILYYQIMKNC